MSLHAMSPHASPLHVPSLRTFLRDETGAVTVDWVVLSAMVLGVVLAVMASVSFGTGRAIDSTFTAINETVDPNDTAAIVSGWGI